MYNYLRVIPICTVKLSKTSSMGALPAGSPALRQPPVEKAVPLHTLNSLQQMLNVSPQNLSIFYLVRIPPQI